MGWRVGIGLAALLLAGCGDSGTTTTGAVDDEPDVTDGVQDATADEPAPDAQAVDDAGAGPDVAPDVPLDVPDVCAPDCFAKSCGPDGCGGVCGTCGEDELCSPGGTCQSFLCTEGEVSCEGDLLVQCDDPAVGPTVLQTCALGCEDGACVTTCEPGASLGCVGGVAKRCDALGLASFNAQCLAGCDADGEDCEPLGAEERVIATGEGQGDEVSRFALASSADGTLLLIWTRAFSSGIRVLMLDSDGNAITGPSVLAGSAAFEPTQLAVSPDPIGGAFSAMAVYPHPTGSAPAVAVWRVTRGGQLVESDALADAEVLTFPSLVALQGRTTVFHLASAGAGGGENLSRTSWLTHDPVPLVEVVDAAETERYDVIATAVGPQTAHVFASLDGGLRLATSTTSQASSGTTSLGAGDFAFVDVATAAAHSLVLALRFDEPERYEYRAVASLDDTGAWVDIGKSTDVAWAQIAPSSSGVVVVRQTVDGALEQADGDAIGFATSWAPIWTPGPGAEREDFDLVLPGGEAAVRLVTRGRDGSGETSKLRIRLLD